VAPIEEGYKWEAGVNGGNHTYAPLCAVAQHLLAGDKVVGLETHVGLG